MPMACGLAGGLLSSSPEVRAVPVLAPQLASVAPGQPAVVSDGRCPCRGAFLCPSVVPAGQGPMSWYPGLLSGGAQ